MKKFLILMATLIFITSCGGGPEKTKASLTFGTNFLQVSNSDGGVYLIGKNLDTNDDFAIAPTNFDTEFELTNGKWQFIAVAWDGLADPTKKLEGAIKCANITTELTGEDTTVSLELLPANCNDPAFGPAYARDISGNPLPTSIRACGNELSSCVNSTPRSARVIIKEKDPVTGITKDGITSRCFSDSDSSTSEIFDVSSNLKLLQTTLRTSFNKFEVEYYSDATCNIFDYRFVSKNSFTPSANWSVYSNGTKLFISTLVPICDTVSGSSNIPFNNKDGTVSYICNLSQLQEVQTSALANIDIEFLRDVDLGAATYTNPIITSNFTGSIRGNNHRIFNGTLDGSSQTNSFGIFSSINGSTTYIQDLKVENINLISPTSSGYASGVLAGSVSGGTQLLDVEANNITISAVGSSMVGALVGSYSHSSPTDMMSDQIGSVSNIQISATNASQVGAAFGKIAWSDQTSKASSLEGSLINITIQDSNTIGGLVGEAQMNGVFNRLHVDGLKMEMISSATPSNWFGGVIGKDSGSAARKIKDISITDSWIGTDTKPFTAAGKIGGVIGISDTAGGVLENILVRNLEINAIENTATPNAVGGILGSGKLTIQNALFDGVIDTDLSDVGGVIGATDIQNISESKSFGEIYCASTCGGIIGKQLQPGGTFSKLYSSMKITATGNTVGGIIAYANQPEIDTVTFEGEISGTNTLAGIAGIYASSGATTNIMHSSTNAKITDIDSGDSVALVVNSAQDVGGSTLIIQNGVFRGKRSDGSVIEQTVLTSTLSTLQASTNCLINGTANSTDAFGCSQKIDLTDITGTFLAIGPVGWRLNTSTSIFEIDYLLDQKELGVLAKLGSPLDPYTISSPMQWNLIEAKPFFMDKAFLLTSNLTFTGTFHSIGNSTNPFTGMFVGNGKIISGINKSITSATEPLGLFSVIGAGARINPRDSYPEGLVSSYSLILKNNYFESDYYNVGTLAGLVQDSASLDGFVTIENVAIYGDSNPVTTELNLLSGAESIGGAVGKTTLSNAQTLLKRIKVAGVTINSDMGAIGGVVGSAMGASYGATLLEVFFNGTITGSISAAGAGGIVGVTGGDSININRAVSKGTVTITGDNAGGIVGSLAANNRVENSYSTASITSTDFAGCIAGGANSAPPPIIKRSFAMCPTLSATTISAISPYYNSESEENFFFTGTDSYSAHQVSTYANFSDYAYLSALYGGPLTADFRYDAGKPPYLPFESEI